MGTIAGGLRGDCSDMQKENAISMPKDLAGRLTVDLLDAESKPLAGYTAEDCIAIEEDSVAICVRWRGGKGLRALAGQPVRLRFALNNARLYSYWCAS